MSSNNINKIHLFGKQLKLLMHELGIKQRKLAELAGMNESNISRLAGGTSTPTLKFLILLVENYGVSLNWLILGEGPMLLSEIDNTDYAQRDEFFIRRLKNIEEMLDQFVEVAKDVDLIKQKLNLS